MPASTSTRHRSKSRWSNPDIAIATLFVAAATVLPLLFWIGTEETFALPKLIGMTVATALGLALAGWMTMRAGRSSALRMRLPDWLVAGFFILLSVSFWLSIDQGQSFLGERFQRQGFVAMIGYLSAYVLARVAVTHQIRLRLLLRGAAIAGTATAAYGLIQWAGFDPIWNEVPGDRVFSTLGQTNALGAYLAMTIPLTMAITPDGTRQRVMRAGATIVQLGALFLSFSRGAYFGLAVGVVIITTMAFHGWEKQRRRMAPVAAVFMLVVIAGVVALSPLQAEVDRAGTRVAESFDTEGNSVRVRLDFWEVALAMSADRPLIGSGPDTYALLFPEYRDEVLTPERAALYLPYRVESPHNVYLAIATGSGIPAAVIYVALVATVLILAARTAWSTSDRRHALLIGGVVAALAAHSVTDLFMTAELAGSWLAWGLLGALTAACLKRPDPAVPASSSRD